MIAMIICIQSRVIAADLTKDIITQTEESFGINNFINETKKYTGDFLKDTDISEMLNSAISGKLDNSTFLKRILNIFGKEIVKTIKTLIGILVIVLIHSILKSVADGLETSNISKIIYYAQYILIITLVISNFSDIILSITNTIITVKLLSIRSTKFLIS